MGPDYRSQRGHRHCAGARTGVARCKTHSHSAAAGSVRLRQSFNRTGTEVRVVTADLNEPSAPQQIYDATVGAGLAVEILVNNAGLGQYGTFAQSQVDQELSQVRVNCEATVRLTRLFLPHMVERRRGWVLVLASTASFQPVTYLTTYAATKAFDRFFAQGLAAEVARFGVNVTALCPGPTESEFFDVARSENFMPGGKQSAKKWRASGLMLWHVASGPSSSTSAADLQRCSCAFCPRASSPIKLKRGRGRKGSDPWFAAGNA